MREVLMRYLSCRMLTVFCIALFCIALILSGCGVNVYYKLGDKNSDEALLFDAKTAVNAQSYDNAISIITTKVSASGQLTLGSREILASAYAGKCGLNFIDYIDELATSLGSLFTIVSAPFVGIAVDPASCLSALQTLDLIGTNAERTPGQNAFAAVVGMVLMGSATRLYTDVISLIEVTSVNGDGTQDAVDISCGLDNTSMNNVVLGYAYMSLNFAALAAQLGGSSGTTISGAMAVCTAIPGSLCSNTDPALISDVMRQIIRNLMNTTTFGVGDKDGSTPLLIATACPP